VADDVGPAPAGPGGEPDGSAETGQRVEHTGIAPVHEGEYIVPAAGSEAVIAPASGGGPVVNYYFPVEVELVGDVDDAVVQRVVSRVFAELDRELASRQ
jgi:hypothetical protein